MKFEVLSDEGIADLLMVSTIRVKAEHDGVDLFEVSSETGEISFLVTSMGGGGFLLPALVLV